VAALDALTPADFSLVRTQTLLFANTQYVRVMDRLMALRGGARGLSLANLDISIDAAGIPVAELAKLAKEVFGGGASADEPGGLLDQKWGFWGRGNVSFGDGDTTTGRPSFDVDQWAIIGGVDYRWTDKAVVGAALALGDSTIDFSTSQGGLDTQSWALSLYGSLYAAKNVYIDGIVNAANSSFDAQRNITYVDGIGLVNADAKGDTDGLTISAGLSGGYDFLVGGFTLSPNVGLFYIDANIDGFTETGARGLNLIYDDQKFTSLTANLGLRATYAWNLPWGVVLPHVRVDYVREFEDDVEVFGVRFASDPDAAGTPPILVETESPDSSYLRLAAGLSAQLPYGISGYIEYQMLQGFEAISFSDLSLGVRFQRGF
jgi:outer membrane autotransporter protein